MSEFKKNALSVKVGKAEIIAFLIYVVGLIAIISFHELWFDEAQAWQIAKTASLKKILFEVPHYEGHPQLWHLLLAIFAKNGFPYELTMRAVNITIASSAMALFIFKSPFPKIFRCTVPFSYFLFYQFGIYSRPYCITMLSIFLAAAFYKNRNEHPWKYILSLTLLCYSSAFGVLIAGALCMVWSGEIISELVKNKKIAKFYTDKRLYPLLFILGAAILIMLSILPHDDTFYSGVDNSMPLLNKITTPAYYLIALIIPFDSWCGFYLFSNTAETPLTYFCMFSFGSLSWFTLSAIAAKNKKFLTFFLPTLFACLFMTFKYVSQHHIGIITLMIIFMFWIILDCNHKIEIPEFFVKIVSGIKSGMIKKVIIAAGAVIFFYPMYYTVASCYYETYACVGTSGYVKFIKEHDFTGRKLMAEWIYKEEQEEEEESTPLKSKQPNLSLDKLIAMLKLPSEHPEIKAHYTYINGIATVIEPYFDENIFMNYNVDCPDEMYVHYKYKEDYKKVLKEWEKEGLPDFIFGYVPLDEVYDEKTLEGVTYLPVFETYSCNIYKDFLGESKALAYIREDLLDEYPELYWIYDPKRNLAEKVNHDED